MQHGKAKELLEEVNASRPSKEKNYRRCLNTIAFAFFAPIRVLDWLRTSRLGHLLVKLGFVRDRTWTDCRDEQKFACGSDSRREARVQATMDDTNLTWTMSMAFYVLSGGCVYRYRDDKHCPLKQDTISYLAKHDSESLLPLQRAILQNPGNSNAIGKAITCVQAFWFCSQCIARIGDNLAVSLLELDTFAHCISALLIYVFWWDKPYDVESHIFIEASSLDLLFLIRELESRDICPLLGVEDGKRHISRTKYGSLTGLIVDINGTPLMHVPARKFNYRSREEYSFTLLGSGGDRPEVRIPDTGFYLHVEPSDTVVDVAWYCNTHNWQSFWKAWVDMDCPSPREPLSLGGSIHLDRVLGVPDLVPSLIYGFKFAWMPTTTALIMTLIFAIYGGLHLLAWQYSFISNAERCLWQISSVLTTLAGLIMITVNLSEVLRYYKFVPLPHEVSHRRYNYTKAVKFFLTTMHVGLRGVSYVLVFLNVASRAFLFVESFIALPNSPRSTYIIPSWTAYIPHM